MAMDQSAFLAAISAAVKRKQAGEDPEVNPTPRAPAPKFMPSVDPNIDVAPPKPDPEAAANSQINAAVNAPPVDPRKTMNPITGLPMSVQQPAMNPDDQARIQQQADKVEMMKRYYQNMKAQPGQ